MAGAVAGAIAKRAEKEFARITLEQQVLTRRVFTRLVHVARPEQGGEDTRQRANIDDMSVETQEVVNVLADARLLVTGRDESTGRQIAEVTHEALIRHWERLRNWVNEERDFLLWQQRLALYLSTWTASRKEDQWSKLRGAVLEEARQWLQKRREFLSEREQEFIEASTKAAKKTTFTLHL